MLVAFTVTVAILAHHVQPFVRARIIDGLSRHFHTHVELDSFHLSIGNGFRGEWGVWAQGRGLRIWPPLPEGASLSERPEGEPLVRLSEFSFNAPLRYKSGVPININDVRIKGLALRMPPKSRRVHVEDDDNPGTPAASSIKIRIARIDCVNADLVLETDKPGKLPKEFAIPMLKLTNVDPDTPIHFEASLTNPVPVGMINTRGTFGPWNVSDPAESPVQGAYAFNNADLGTIKGISGILNSTGTYTGTLRNIVVDGVTDTRAFSLSNSDNTLPLHTTFHAVVDGTDGDTYLNPVDATLGRSHIIAKGQIVRVLAPDSDGDPKNIGHDIALSINIDRGHIEDFLRISTSGSTPILTGNLALNTMLHIPPGRVPVAQKMMLTDGNFDLTQAQFTSNKVQDRIVELSLRGQGRTSELKSNPPQDVQADMNGDFKLVGGNLTLSRMQFVVPGAEIRIAGSYGLDSGALDFQGVARLDASVSKIVGGWKGILLTPADPFFKKDGAGTAVPIHVRGTRKNPEFGIDLKGMKHTSPQRPGTPS